MACMIWRSPSSSTSPRNGRTLGPKSQRTSRNSPSPSIRRGTDNQQRVGRGWRMVEIGIEAGGQCVKRVTNAGSWRGSMRDQRLRPEPDSQRQRREHNPANQATPFSRGLGVGHCRESTALAGATCTGAFTAWFRDFQREFARFSQVQLARAEIRQISLRAKTDPGRGRHSAGKSHLAKQLQSLPSAYLPAACAAPSGVRLFFSSGTAVTTNTCSVAFASSCSLSSTLMCGTISPPILLKRLKRSVTRRNPSSSSDRDVAGVVPAVAQNFGGFFRLVQVALHHVRPAHEQVSPGLIDGQRLQRFRIDNFHVIPGSGCPMLPRFAPTWRNDAARKSIVFTVTTGEHSVQP